MAQQRRLAGAVAAEQRDALAGRERERDAGEDRAAAGELVPDAAAAAALRRGVRPRRRSAGAATGAGGSGAGQQPGGAQRRARLLDAGGRRVQAEAGDQRGARRLERRRRAVRPVEEPARRGVADDGAAVERDHAVGGAQAALEPVLGEQDRRPPLLVEPAQQREQLVAGDRVELRGRLVEHEQPRAPGERGAERDALAARRPRASTVARSSSASMPERERDLLDRRARRRPRCGRGSRAGTPARARTVPITICVSGSWNSVPTSRASAAGPCSRRSMPQISARPSKRPPWKCGTRPLRDAEQRRLARRRAAGEHDELALGDLERERRAARAPPRPGSGR